jgi:hypothetical protein
MIPHENNPYVAYSQSGNELFVDILNPYGYMSNFAVQVITPLLPSYPTPLPNEPTFALGDFLVWARPLKEFLDEGNDSIFTNLYNVLVSLAKVRVRWNLIQEEHIWKRLIALYIAHYMQLTIKAWKDEQNNMSLNEENTEKKQTYILNVGNSNYEDFDSTIYGKQFWHEYKSFGQFQWFGVML